MTPEEARERGIKVKPLVWEKFHNSHLSFCCIGEYLVQPTANKENSKHVCYFLNCERSPKPLGYKDGEADAKDAAQADYERRILEVLE